MIKLKPEVSMLMADLPKQRQEMVKKISLNKDWLISNSLPINHYTDAYCLTTKSNHGVDLTQLPLLFFNSFPKWFRGLLYIREFIAKRLGLKTAHNMDVREQIKRFNGDVGDSIALFHVMERNDQEILTGEDDRHLDFRLSFILEHELGHQRIIMATAVQYNNLVGRIYFLPVKPIHRIIVPLILKRISRQTFD